MEPGVYPDGDSVTAADAAYWNKHAYTFGGWQFLPATGEIRRNGILERQLSPVLAEALADLIAAYPKYIPGSQDDKKQNVKRLRDIIGANTILSVHAWGYRFNPEAVL